jgi:succinate dehydrogenase/fumarate reductase flavoprotein subunit
LYAAGEAAGGIWGANRIAGTGGTEIMVFGKTAGRAAASYAGGASVKVPVEGFSVPQGTLDPLPVFREIQTLLANCGGLGRDRTRLEKGIRELERIEKDALERVSTRPLAHLLTYLDTTHGCVVAQMVLGAALRREETRGFHKRLDYPRKNDRDFLGNFVMQKDHLDRLATRFWPHGR